jgi:hypothetical protein
VVDRYREKGLGGVGTSDGSRLYLTIVNRWPAYSTNNPDILRGITICNHDFSSALWFVINEDGAPLGFCEQMDLHDSTATIREALEFSAMLRQDAEVPKEEKLEYVDQVIELLELKSIQHAIIASLGVEQRKRLTIGVELAAKPSLLLFLDEVGSISSPDRLILHAKRCIANQRAGLERSILDH